jgi:2-deoxy-D-gluconate 3-dehydrogenase
MKRMIDQKRRPVALVTGASAGLGRAIALRLAEEDFDLAVTDLDVAMLDALRREPALANRAVIALALDVRQPDSVATAMEEVLRRFGRIDVLVNNAGRALQRPAIAVTWAEWDDVLAINLRGAFFLSQAAARHWIDSGRPGAIVNIASTHGLTGLAGRSVYGISKGGLIQMTRMLAIEWAPSAIRVNAVAPATVLTPSRAEMLKDPDVRQQMLARIPLGRFPAPEEVAAAVAYLASEAAASVTGHVLVLDGGLTTQ